MSQPSVSAAILLLAVSCVHEEGRRSLCTIPSQVEEAGGCFLAAWERRDSASMAEFWVGDSDLTDRHLDFEIWPFAPSLVDVRVTGASASVRAVACLFSADQRFPDFTSIALSLHRDHGEWRVKDFLIGPTVEMAPAGLDALPDRVRQILTSPYMDNVSQEEFPVEAVVFEVLQNIQWGEYESAVASTTYADDSDASECMLELFGLREGTQLASSTIASLHRMSSDAYTATVSALLFGQAEVCLGACQISVVKGQDKPWLVDDVVWLGCSPLRPRADWRQMLEVPDSDVVFPPSDGNLRRKALFAQSEGNRTSE